MTMLLMTKCQCVRVESEKKGELVGSAIGAAEVRLDLPVLLAAAASSLSDAAKSTLSALGPLTPFCPFLSTITQSTKQCFLSLSFQPFTHFTYPHSQPSQS